MWQDIESVLHHPAAAVGVTTSVPAIPTTEVSDRLVGPNLTHPTPDNGGHLSDFDHYYTGPSQPYDHQPAYHPTIESISAPGTEQQLDLSIHSSVKCEPDSTRNEDGTTKSRPNTPPHRY
jgi:hypothetical protein